MARPITANEDHLELITAVQAAEILCLKPKTVYNGSAGTDELSRVKQKGSLRFLRVEVQALRELRVREAWYHRDKKNGQPSPPPPSFEDLRAERMKRRKSRERPKSEPRSPTCSYDCKADLVDNFGELIIRDLPVSLSRKYALGSPFRGTFQIPSPESLKPSPTRGYGLMLEDGRGGPITLTEWSTNSESTAYQVSFVVESGW